LGDLFASILATQKDEDGGLILLDREEYAQWEQMDASARQALIDRLNDSGLFAVRFKKDCVCRSGETCELAELTDRGNALRLIRLFGGNAMYMSLRDKWLCWDGHHWVYDEDERLHREYVPKVVDELRTEAEYQSLMDPEAGKRWYRFMLSSQNTTRINNMFTEARRTMGCRRISPDMLDSVEGARYLFNCRNATIDLVEGRPREQRRSDLLSAMAPVTYDPDAESELWLETIDTIFEYEPSIKPFIRRVFGSCLTGDTDDGKFFFLWGEGQNGKGTMLGTLEKLLGSDQYGYAQHANASTFMAQKGDRIPNDIACLKGSRAVIVGEIKDLRALDISLLKEITGGDPVKARFMREEYFTFMPQFKLFFQGNHRPELGVINKAVERRFVYIPFTTQIPDARRDDKLKEKLLSEENRSGILNWLVEGCRDWLHPPKGETRLRIPSFVEQETREYLEDLDPVGAFLKQCTQPAENNLQHKALHELYEKWRRVCDKKQLSVQALSSIMQDKGYRRIKPHNKVHWCGIGFEEEEKKRIEEEYEYLVRSGDQFIRDEEKPHYLRHSTKDYEEVYDY